MPCQSPCRCHPIVQDTRKAHSAKYGAVRLWACSAHRTRIFRYPASGITPEFCKLFVAHELGGLPEMRAGQDLGDPFPAIIADLFAGMKTGIQKEGIVFGTFRALTQRNRPGRSRRCIHPWKPRRYIHPRKSRPQGTDHTQSHTSSRYYRPRYHLGNWITVKKATSKVRDQHRTTTRQDIIAPRHYLV